MNHTELIQLLQTKDGLKIPGERAHEVFYQSGLRDRKASQQKDANPKLSGVAAILAPRNEESNIVLIKRPVYKGVHSGQMAFPGGKKENEDADLLITALRETEEEIGVDRGKIHHLAEMTKVYIPPSRFLVQPHLFYANAELNYTPEPKEVDHVVLFPVSELLRETVFVHGQVPLNAEGLKVKTWYFQYDDYIVWGATALMMNELKLLIKDLTG